MKTFKHALFALTLPVFMLAAENSQATTSLQTVKTIKQSSESTLLRFHFDDAAVTPSSFMMDIPNMLVLDFPDVLSAASLKNKIIKSGIVKSVKFASASGKLRVMIALKKKKNYTTKVVGNDVVVIFSDQKRARSTIAARPIVT